MVMPVPATAAIPINGTVANPKERAVTANTPAAINAEVPTTRVISLFVLDRDSLSLHFFFSSFLHRHGRVKRLREIVLRLLALG